LLEALALARPVVATAVGGVAGLIDQGASGLLVPPRDPEALGVAIEEVLDDAATAERLGRHGRATVEERFGIARMVRSFEQIYARLLGV
jgi:glycosyltransferase involved in cell wall biosynthesis